MASSYFHLPRPNGPGVLIFDGADGNTYAAMLVVDHVTATLKFPDPELHLEIEATTVNGLTIYQGRASDVLRKRPAIAQTQNELESDEPIEGEIIED